MCCRLELSNSKQTKAGKVMRRISGHMLILVYERIWNVKTRQKCWPRFIETRCLNRILNIFVCSLKGSQGSDLFYTTKFTDCDLYREELLLQNTYL